MSRAEPGRGRRTVKFAFAVALLAGSYLTLAACGAPSRPFPNLPRLSVATRFGVENLCDAGLSPQISLSDVPEKTASYVVQITNVNVLIQSSWRETIPLTSRTEIPEGAAKSYEGPCLGDMDRFPPAAPFGYQHRVEVLAESTEGAPLAYGSIVVLVESPYIAARRERLRLQQPGATALPPPTSVTTPSVLPLYGGFMPSNPYGFPSSNIPGSYGQIAPGILQ